MNATPKTLEPTRQSLLLRLKDWEDQASWTDFFNTYWRLIYSCARKAGLTDAEAQDAVQETIIAVVKSIKNFDYDRKRCKFKSWLMLLTRQRIAIQFHKRQKHLVSSSSTNEEDPATLEELPDPAGEILDSVWTEEWQKNLFEAALERIKSQVKARQFQLFALYALHHWPVKEVASALQVPVMQVYRNKHRIFKLLKKEIKRLEQQDIRTQSQ